MDKQNEKLGAHLLKKNLRDDKNLALIDYLVNKKGKGARENVGRTMDLQWI